jgi:hypothetical protein
MDLDSTELYILTFVSTWRAVQAGVEFSEYGGGGDAGRTVSFASMRRALSSVGRIRARRESPRS